MCDEIQLFNHKLVLIHCRLFVWMKPNLSLFSCMCRGSVSYVWALDIAILDWFCWKGCIHVKDTFPFFRSELLPYVWVWVGQELDLVWNKTNSRFRYPGRRAKYFCHTRGNGKKMLYLLCTVIRFHTICGITLRKLIIRLEGRQWDNVDPDYGPL